MFIAESLKWSAFRDLNVLKLSWKWTWFEGACLHWLGWTVYNKTKHVDNWHVCSGENQVNPDPFTQMLLQMIPSLKKKKRTVKAVFNVTLCELNSWLLTIINQTPDQDLMTQWDYVVYRVLWKQITWTLAWVQSAEHWHPNHAHQSWLHMARQTLQTNRVQRQTAADWWEPILGDGCFRNYHQHLKFFLWVPASQGGVLRSSHFHPPPLVQL